MSKSTKLLFPAIMTMIAGMCVATGSNAETMSDVAYCQALSKNFTTAGGVVTPGGGASIDLNASVAISQCKDKPGSAIPVLEKELRDNGVALPPRT